MHPHMLYILMYLAVGLGAAVMFWFANEQLFFETKDRDYSHSTIRYGITFFLWPAVFAILSFDAVKGRA